MLFILIAVESPVSASAPFQNLDYVYASVQKKPSEQNKLNEHAVNAYNLQNADRMNIQDPSSVSDNSGELSLSHQIIGLLSYYIPVHYTNVIALIKICTICL